MKTYLNNFNISNIHLTASWGLILSVGRGVEGLYLSNFRFKNITVLPTMINFSNQLGDLSLTNIYFDDITNLQGNIVAGTIAKSFTIDNVYLTGYTNNDSVPQTPFEIDPSSTIDVNLRGLNLNSVQIYETPFLNVIGNINKITVQDFDLNET